jgi:hypothetical protein
MGNVVEVVFDPANSNALAHRLNNNQAYPLMIDYSHCMLSTRAYALIPNHHLVPQQLSWSPSLLPSFCILHFFFSHPSSHTLLVCGGSWH